MRSLEYVFENKIHHKLPPSLFYKSLPRPIDSFIEFLVRLEKGESARTYHEWVHMPVKAGSRLMSGLFQS